MSSDFSVVAIIAAYNEADIIDHVVSDLIQQGVHVYLLDDGSTDDTVAVVERYVGRGVVGIERLTGADADAPPSTFEWEGILLRKAAVAKELDADWFIHHDADEFRESPWAHLSLKDAIRRVDALGFNAIDFSGLDFWPVHDTFRAGDDVREAFTFYKEPAPYDRLQIRCWKKTAEAVDLASSGGHDAHFPGRSVFPIRFILRHYPIRGQAHGERKVFQERRNRFTDRERARHWHVQYDRMQEGTSFIRDRSTLTPYDPDAVRLELTLRHRGVEALEAAECEMRSIVEAHRLDLAARSQELAQCTDALVRTHAELDARTAELEARTAALGARTAELGARTAEAAALRGGLAQRSTELAAVRADLEADRAEIAALGDALNHQARHIESLQSTVNEGARRLDEFHRSLSWRWTSPARAAYRVLTGR
jgi:glycosyl transferase family 2